MFYFVSDGNFPSTNPRGAYIWRGDLTEGFLRCRFGGGLYMEGLIFGILRYLFIAITEYVWILQSYDNFDHFSRDYDKLKSK